MDDDWEPPVSGPWTASDLAANIIGSIGGYLIPFLVLGLLLSRWLKRDSTEATVQLDADEVQSYARALGLSIEEAERMLREACAEVPIEIFPNVLLGNAAASANAIALQRADVTHIVNVSTALPNHFEGLAEYLRIPIEDALTADLSAHLDSAVDFMAAAIRDGGAVLVHCKQGVSRSASIVIAYCMREHGLTFREALAHVHKRKWVRPNEAFVEQLRRWEQSLHPRERWQAGKWAAADIGDTSVRRRPSC